MTEESIKARALVLSFQMIVKDFELAKQCALLLVNEKIGFIEEVDPDNISYELMGEIDVCNEVKNEITKL